jgi:hypothetical protein
MLSTNYPAFLTNQKKVIAWNIVPTTAPSSILSTTTLTPQKRAIDVIEEMIIFDELLLDMTDTQYERDLTPLVATCSCHACRSHSKAYIHHLFKSEELLAEILVYTHNQYQLTRLMDVMRSKLNNREEYAKWAKLIIA